MNKNILLILMLIIGSKSLCSTSRYYEQNPEELKMANEFFDGIERSFITCYAAENFIKLLYENKESSIEELQPYIDIIDEYQKLSQSKQRQTKLTFNPETIDNEEKNSIFHGVPSKSSEDIEKYKHDIDQLLIHQFLASESLNEKNRPESLEYYADWLNFSRGEQIFSDENEFTKKENGLVTHKELETAIENRLIEIFVKKEKTIDNASWLKFSKRFNLINLSGAFYKELRKRKLLTK